MFNPQLLYLNSYLHFADKKYIKAGNDEIKEVIINLLDKRFLTTNNIYVIENAFPYCKVKELDDYYFAIYSLFSINKSSKFYELLEKGIIINVYDFIKMIGE